MFRKNGELPDNASPPLRTPPADYRKQQERAPRSFTPYQGCGPWLAPAVRLAAAETTAAALPVGTTRRDCRAVSPRTCGSEREMCSFRLWTTPRRPSAQRSCVENEKRKSSFEAEFRVPTSSREKSSAEKSRRKGLRGAGFHFEPCWNEGVEYRGISECQQQTRGKFKTLFPARCIRFASLFSTNEFERRTFFASAPATAA